MSLKACVLNSLLCGLNSEIDLRTIIEKFSTFFSIIIRFLCWSMKLFEYFNESRKGGILNCRRMATCLLIYDLFSFSNPCQIVYDMREIMRAHELWRRFAFPAELRQRWLAFQRGYLANGWLNSLLNPEQTYYFNTIFPGEVLMISERLATLGICIVELNWFHFIGLDENSFQCVFTPRVTWTSTSHLKRDLSLPAYLPTGKETSVLIELFEIHFWIGLHRSWGNHVPWFKEEKKWQRFFFFLKELRKTKTSE